MSPIVGAQLNIREGFLMHSQISQPTLDRLIEQLAAVEHKRWAHWQRYMHGKCKSRPDGSMVVPAALVQKWERQSAAPYDTLTEAEKESDRNQVRRYIPIVLAALGIDTSGLRFEKTAEDEAKLDCTSE